jgi:hypothetical protein
VKNVVKNLELLFHDVQTYPSVVKTVVKSFEFAFSRRSNFSKRREKCREKRCEKP